VGIFKCELDLSDLADLGADIEGKVRTMAEEAQHQLGAQTFAKINEIASEKLHTRLTMFTDKFHLDEKEGEVILTLEASAVWIDDGLKPNFLLDALLNSPKAKSSADGGKYMVVPFVNKPGMGPTNTTPYNMDILNAVKAELKKEGISKSKNNWFKIQRDPQGRPILGKIADLKNIRTPNKTHEGAGMGQGAIGEERKSRNNIPYLQGASVYQTEGENGKINRSVVTFRTASSKHPENFQHPGLPAQYIIENGYEWALNELENVILPKLVQKVLNS
jgi:hypothetical protein